MGLYCIFKSNSYDGNIIFVTDAFVEHCNMIVFQLYVLQFGILKGSVGFFAHMLTEFSTSQLSEG
jgi:hypothetical protein